MPVDLRWGLTKEDTSATGLGAIEYCLREVDASRPFFLMMEGERYGGFHLNIKSVIVKNLNGSNNIHWVMPSQKWSYCMVSCANLTRQFMQWSTHAIHPSSKQLKMSRSDVCLSLTTTRPPQSEKN